MPGELPKKNCEALKVTKNEATAFYAAARVEKERAFARANRHSALVQQAHHDLEAARLDYKVKSLAADRAKREVERCRERLAEGLEENCDEEEQELRSVEPAAEKARKKRDAFQESFDRLQREFDLLAKQFTEANNDAKAARTSLKGVEAAQKEGHCFRFKQ